MTRRLTSLHCVGDRGGGDWGGEEVTGKGGGDWGGKEVTGGGDNMGVYSEHV